MDDIKDIVKQVIGSIATQQPSEQKKLQDCWEKILSQSEQKHARISGFKDGALSVYVDTPAWLYQFNLKKQKILNEIQKEFSEIQKIYFKIGKV